MINVVTTVYIKKGKNSDFLKKFKAVLSKIKQEQGCIEYFAAIDLDTKIPIQKLENNVIMILEKWVDIKCLHDHLNAPHMIKYLKEVQNLIENVSIKVLQEV